MGMEKKNLLDGCIGECLGAGQDWRKKGDAGNF